ncbi:MAG: redoxin domain-containing protein [Hamadaea sp.]|uniref:redoxin domain-containing protein n=1 Tax=Hamadaea sp. TaxID=2024425 RepID=UPI0018403E86|nr:redoxin domain-containing protein [Hamadaea sp.]NUR71736.1 redoxin domain-containing protein [Hamadaea sp.]NUT19050.1 redoxin domain-containing protein [Hamadaea sp.]
MTEMPQSGDKAPDFTLPFGPGETVSLSSLRGRPVVLAFYPADFSPVCSDQMALYQAVKSEFDRYDAQLFGISVDGVWCHRAFADSRNLRFPLLSDFEPKGEVSRAYGSYDAELGESLRNLFVIDASGTVFWSFASPNGVNPGADGILSALEAMSGGDAS